MCDQDRVRLGDAPRAAAAARGFVADQCARWALQEIRDDLVLPVSELVTNAIVHAGTPSHLTISLAGRIVEVAVHDGSPRAPIMRPVRVDPLGDIDRAAPVLTGQPLDRQDPSLQVGEAGSIVAGRGLLIVDAVADEWGIAELRQGKTVWFRIQVPERWSFPQPCGCAAGRSRTPGGLALDA